MKKKRRTLYIKRSLYLYGRKQFKASWQNKRNRTHTQRRKDAKKNQRPSMSYEKKEFKT